MSRERVDALRTPFFISMIEGLPPTVNHLYRTSRSGCRYKTSAGKEWQNRTVVEFKRVIAEHPSFFVNGPYDGPVCVLITFYVDNKRKWDIDNRVKALQDCLEMAGVIKNDWQIEELYVKRMRNDLLKTSTSIHVIRI